jgi:ribosomal protein S18 acetylase RimI-like enzyme
MPEPDMREMGRLLQGRHHDKSVMHDWIPTLPGTDDTKSGVLGKLWYGNSSLVSKDSPDRERADATDWPQAIRNTRAALHPILAPAKLIDGALTAGRNFLHSDPINNPQEAGPAAFEMAMNVAVPGMGAARPANSVGMFGGRKGAEQLAKSGELRPQQAMDLGERMKASGASREDIYAATNKILDGSDYAGVSYGKDGKPRFEIDDSKSTAILGKGDIKDKLVHPNLYNAYPEIGNGNARFAIGPADGMSRPGIYDTIVATDRNTGKVRSTALHELDHLVQSKEGFASGGTPESFMKNPASLRLTPSDLLDKWRAFKQYERLAGETQARTVEARRDLTPEQRRARAPWLDYDVPEANQIVRFGGGTQASFGGPMPKGYSAKPETIGNQTNYAIHNGDKQVGNAYVRDLGDNAQVGKVHIDPEHQRKGIGTSLYGQIERDLGKPVIPDGTLSDSAYAMWQKHRPEAVANYEKQYGSWSPKDSEWKPSGAQRSVNPELSAQSDALKRLLSGTQASIPEKPPIRAYHGSPHDFDKFDISKIGTGEGAQAFGHGLYFAENEGVAKSYRDALAPGDFKTKGVSLVKSSPVPLNSVWPTDLKAHATSEIAKANANIDAAMSSIKQREAAKGNIDSNTWDWSEHTAAKKRFDDLRADPSKALTPEQIERLKAEYKTPGHMYEVGIKADPEHFLDWDKPIGQHGPEVQSAIRRAMNLNDGSKMADIGFKNISGQNAGSLIDGMGKSPEFTADLKNSGIPGIKYLDQGSRGAGTGSRNYVVFDPAIIEIMRKYGIVPGMMGGAAALGGGGHEPEPAQYKKLLAEGGT